MTSAMDSDDLYGLPLDRFIPERGAIAKALRKDGRRDEASEVASLRKPSVAAWAVNQLVRTQRTAIRALFDAGDDLREAQSNLLAGSGDGRALRAAGDHERAAVEALVERARGLLSSAGNELSAGVIDRVSDTLHAAALDEEAREHVLAGRLERELRHIGLGFGLGAGTAPEPAPRPVSRRPKEGVADGSGTANAAGAGSSSAKTDAPAAPAKTAAARNRAERERREHAAEERAEAERVRRERSAARRDARAAHASARRRADAATRALHAAKTRRDEAAHALTEADEALAAARHEAADAGTAMQRAQADLNEAEGAS